MSKIILENCTLLNEEGQIITSRYLLISDGIIKTISQVPFKNEETTDTLDCRNLIVSPGFVNLHTHSPMNIFKGIAEDVDEYAWFNEEIWPYESKMDEDDVYAGCKLAIAEMLNNGVTAFADHYFNANMICNAVLETGIRGDIAPTLFGMSGGFEDQLQASARLIKEYDGQEGRLSLRFGPHSPYTCNPEELRQTANLSETLNKGIHLHVADAEAQIQKSLELYGKTPFQVLAETGVLDRPLIVGHGLWILPDEKKLITQNTWFSICPTSYMKLSAGMGRIWEYHKELPLCIGTDGSASSNSQNPLEQLKLFLLVGKLNLNNAEDFTLEEGWKMIMRGHEALDFKAGKIKEGYKADLVFWDLNRINTMPVYKPLASIIYSSSSENIIHNMIDGKFVKKNGQLNLDIESIKTEAMERAKSILNKGKGRT